jgi:hypothetical protein
MVERTGRYRITVLAIAILVLLFGIPLGAKEDRDELAKRIRAAIEKLESEEDLDPVARELASLGPDALPMLFLAYREGLFDFRKVYRREALLRSFRHVPPSELDAFIRAQVLGDAPPGMKIAGINVLGAAGRETSMGLLLEIVGELRADVATLPSTPGCVCKALTGILRGGTGGFKTIESRWDRLPLWIRWAAVDAAEKVGDGAALRFLVRLAGRDPATEATILERVARMPVSGFGTLDTTETVGIAAALGREDPETRRAAALVVGRLHLHDAFEDLLELLEDEVDHVRAAALRSVRQMTGARFGADKKRWLTWLWREKEWLAFEWRGQIRAVYAERAKESLVVLDGIARRRLYREYLIREILPILEDKVPTFRVAGCAVLGRLGSPAAIPALIETLEDKDEQVRSAAAAALAAVTGLPSDQDPATWKKALEAAR